MANKVLLKKSSVAAKVPLTSDLDYGEVALNYADGKLYFKNSSNTINSFDSSASDLLTKLKTVDGAGSGLDADTLDGVQGSSYATLTGTQTLTNKTLSGAILSGSLTAGGGVGSAGQVLTSTGSGVQWSSVSGGGSGYSDLLEISQTGISTSTALNSASATSYRGAKYTIQITNSTAYAMYEFLVMHDGTGVYFPYNSSAYAGDSSGNFQNYFHGDYLDSIALTKIQVGDTYHAFNWSITGGNLVFSASCSSGTIDVKGTALLIKV